MAKRTAVPSKEVQLHIIGPQDTFKASRIQTVNWGKEIPSTTLDELGNSQHAGESQDAPNVTASVSAFDVGIKIFSALTGTDPTAYPAEGVDISKLTEVDLALFIKDADASDYAKSGHARRLQVQDFTYNYSLDGESTEDYTFVGAEKRWLKYDVCVEKFTGSGAKTLTGTPIQLKNGKYLLSVILDGGYLTEVTTVPTLGEYSYNSGTKTLTFGDTLTASSVIQVVFHGNPAGNNWTDISDEDLVAAIKGNNVKVTISANTIQRVQSVSINGRLNSTAVKEMGNRNTVGYQTQNPTVEGTITVLDTDTDLVSLLTEGVVGSGVEWQPGEGCVTTTVDLIIKLLDPCDTSENPRVVKTVRVPDIKITGESYASSVNQNATETFNWKSAAGQCLVYSGEYNA
jgi:hypothetical protein